MSTPSDESNPDLRYAEYVLGVLEAQERAQVEREMAESETVAAAVERWRRRLLPLAVPFMASPITETGGRAVGLATALSLSRPSAAYARAAGG